MESQNSRHISRRAVAHGTAWSIPVLSVAATAPSFAASPCTQRNTVSTTTGSVQNPDLASPAPGYTRNSGTTATWTTADPAGPTYTFATISVTEERTTSTPGTENIQYGFATNDTQNLALFNTGTVVGPSINQRPTNNASPRGFANRTVTTFSFDRTVYGLTFQISDISKSATPETVTAASQLTAVAFWDTVYVESPGAWTFTNRGSAVSGAGTVGSPFTAAITASNADQNANSDVTIVFSGGVEQVKIHYWSADLVANANDTGGGQGITISNMTMQIAPAICL